MSYDYLRAQSTADRLIKRFGQEAKVVTKVNTGVSYDPTIEEVKSDCILAVMKYKNSDIDGTLIKRTDKKVYISTEGLESPITKSDVLEIEGVAHNIIDVMPLSPAGLVVFYEAQVRA